MRLPLVCLTVLLPASVAGQTPTKFEIADIHLSPKTAGVYMRVGSFQAPQPGRYELHSASMLDLVRTAYGVDADKVTGGPNWLETDRFEVIARHPADATPEMLKLMLQSLLAERFQLVVHKDLKLLPAYALMAAKKPLLQKTDGTGEPGCKTTRTPGVSTLHVSCHSETMADFAEAMRRIDGVWDSLKGNPVVDQTGLRGQWDFAINVSPLNPFATAVPNAITIFDALENQLGLKLQPAKVPLPVIVVDSVSQKPTENAPGVTQTLSPVPHIEVADIKLSDPAATGQRGVFVQPGGRLLVHGVTLQGMIRQAWRLRSDDPLAGSPKWLDTDRFDIVAKASAPLNDDSMFLALRAVLADRFRLVTHFEDQPLPVYALMAVKPKLTRADPANRFSCKSPTSMTGALSNRNANGIPVVFLNCQNTTMAQLAEKIYATSFGDVQHPVFDATGLEGNWDFNLTWSPADLVQIANRSAAASGDGTGAASDPSGVLTMPQALEKQLGLKLEPQKRPLPVLVIDHVEQKPTEN